MLACSLAGEGVGGPNSDDWEESLELYNSVGYTKDYCCCLLIACITRDVITNVHIIHVGTIFSIKPRGQSVLSLWSVCFRKVSFFLHAKRRRILFATLECLISCIFPQLIGFLA